MLTRTSRGIVGMLTCLLAVGLLAPLGGCCSRCAGNQCDISLAPPAAARQSQPTQARSVLKLTKGSPSLIAARR